MTALLLMEAVVLALLTLLVVGLLRSHAAILRRLHELGAGLDPLNPSGARSPSAVNTVPGTISSLAMTGRSHAHDVIGETIDGDDFAMAVVGASFNTIIAFLSSGCLTCATFWKAFSDPQIQLPDNTRLVVVAKGRQDESVSTLKAVAPTGAPTVLSTQTWNAYAIQGSPFFVLVHGPSGRIIGEGSAASWKQVLGLLSQALADAAEQQVSKGRVTVNRQERIDAELLAAGIGPSHPSLYGAPSPTSHRESDEQ